MEQGFICQQTDADPNKTEGKFSHLFYHRSLALWAAQTTGDCIVCFPLFPQIPLSTPASDPWLLADPTVAPFPTGERPICVNIIFTTPCLQTTKKWTLVQSWTETIYKKVEKYLNKINTRLAGLVSPNERLNSPFSLSWDLFRVPVINVKWRTLVRDIWFTHNVAYVRPATRTCLRALS